MERRSLHVLRLLLLPAVAAFGCGGGMASQSGAGGNGGNGGMTVPDSGAGGGAGAAAGGNAGAAPGGAGGTVDPRCQVAWAGDVQVGTAADDQVLGMTFDADGSVFVSGYEGGIVGVTNIEPDGDSRAVVLKYGPAGTLAWKAVLDTAAADTAEDVAIDRATGDVVVVGRTSGAFPTFTNQGQFDTFLALLDPGGRTLTVLQSGNERPQHPVRLGLAPGGAVLVGGWDDTYVPTNYVAANQDGFIAAFSLGAGPSVSETTPLQYLLVPGPTSPLSLVTGVAAEQDGSGAVYVTFLVTGQSSHGIFVTKLLADLAVAWTSTISTLPFDAATAVALSPSGELFVTGATFLTLGRRSFGQEDAFLFKIDKQTGAPVWAAQAGGADSDYPTALAFDAAGNVYISGVTLGAVAEGEVNQGSVDVFAMKFAPTGELRSVWQTGTADDDEATALAVDPCGNVLVGGYTRGALVSGQPSAGGEDMFIVRADLRDVPPAIDGAPQLPSCIGLPAICGAAQDDSCCESPAITGGAYERGFDVAGDVDSGSTAYPATVGDFRLDRYEVTVGRFRAFVNAGLGTQARPPAAGAGAHARVAASGWDASWNTTLPASTEALVAALKCDPTFQTWTDAPGGNEQRPIDCVSWYEAVAFCAWDGGFLPTEAEWNYAAAGGEEQRAYPWSSPAGSLTIDAAHASYWDGTDCTGDGMPDCALTDLGAVGTKPAGDGRWGQADLAGNVLEWTLDFFAAYPLPCSDCANLTLAAHRVIRGGSYGSDEDDLRGGRRLGIAPSDRNGITGIRCARAP